MKNKSLAVFLVFLLGATQQVTKAAEQIQVQLGEGDDIRQLETEWEKRLEQREENILKLLNSEALRGKEELLGEELRKVKMGWEQSTVSLKNKIVELKTKTKNFKFEDNDPNKSKLLITKLLDEKQVTATLKTDLAYYEDQLKRFQKTIDDLYKDHLKRDKRYTIIENELLRLRTSGQLSDEDGGFLHSITEEARVTSEPKRWGELSSPVEKKRQQVIDQARETNKKLEASISFIKTVGDWQNESFLMNNLAAKVDQLEKELEIASKKGSNPDMVLKKTRLSQDLRETKLRLDQSIANKKELERKLEKVLLFKPSFKTR